MPTGKELQILQLLRENARYTVTEISRKVNLPRSTVYEKIKRLRNDGIVSKYSCLLNFAKLGMPIQIKVLLKSGSKDRAKLGESLNANANANNIIKLGNDFDYLVSFAFSSMEDFHKALDAIIAGHEISDYKILYVAKELKREGFLL